MLLDGKHAIVYGGGGAIGGAVARALAREGATVHLAGRTPATLDAVAEDIRAAGGTAHTAQVDALDEAAVDAHADGVAASAGAIDISFNAISYGDVQGTPLAEMPLADFERPVVTATRTTRAAARHMIRQRSGVLLMFGGDGGRQPIRDYSIGGFVVALNAVEALRRQLAAELGPHGIRSLTLHTGGVPESMPADLAGRDAITAGLVGATMLGRTTLDDVGDVASFAASDKARSMTATAINITCGAVAD